jgi:hypothetical protein
LCHLDRIVGKPQELIETMGVAAKRKKAPPPVRDQGSTNGISLCLELAHMDDVFMFWR